MIRESGLTIIELELELELPTLIDRMESPNEIIMQTKLTLTVTLTLTLNPNPIKP